jgi:NTP pyrophosphatase (non-canonical NTP hydrolase)
LELFQWDEAPDKKYALAEELAKVGLYSFQIARIAGIDLENEILNKLDINYRRKRD